MGNFPLGGGGPENFENFSHFFLFIFKHGLNHPEMKRNFFSKVGTPPLSLHQWEISQLVFNLFLLCQVFLGEGSPILGVPTSKFGDGSLILGALGEGSPILGVPTVPCSKTGRPKIDL